MEYYLTTPLVVGQFSGYHEAERRLNIGEELLLLDRDIAHVEKQVIKTYFKSLNAVYGVSRGLSCQCFGSF